MMVVEKARLMRTGADQKLNASPSSVRFGCGELPAICLRLGIAPSEYHCSRRLFVLRPVQPLRTQFDDRL